MITPLPDRLKLNTNETRAHLIHRRSLSDLENLGDALKVEKRSEDWCGVEGKLRVFLGNVCKNTPQLKIFFLFFFCHIADAANERSEREVFDLPSSVNYNQEYTIETLVVADKKMTDFHGVEELKTYVPTLINIVRKKNPHDLRRRYRSRRANSARREETRKFACRQSRSHGPPS